RCTGGRARLPFDFVRAGTDQHRRRDFSHAARAAGRVGLLIDALSGFPRLARRAPPGPRGAPTTPVRRPFPRFRGGRLSGFAPPYGHVNRAVLADLARTYEVAFGTRFDRARPQRDRYDVPRIEMHYFRAARYWRGFLNGEWSYFLARRALRSVKNAATLAAR